MARFFSGSKMLVMFGLFATVFLSDHTMAANYSHMRAYKALYRYPPRDSVVKEYQWVANHLDMGHFGDQPSSYAPIIRNANPDFKILWGNNAIHFGVTSSKNDLLEDWCSRNGYVTESCYLHYYDNTRVEHGGDIVDIPGWGGGSASSMYEARVKSWIWDAWQYLLYPGYEGTREFNAWYYDSVTTTSYRPSPDYDAIVYDGVYFDVHSPIILANDPIYGGTIFEYDADKDEAQADYMAGRVMQMQTMNERCVGKFLIINVAEYWHVSYAKDEAVAADGAFLEFVPNILRAGHVVHWDFAKGLVDLGKVAAYSAISKSYTPDSGTMPKGMYGNTEERVSMFYAANYYMANEDTLVFWSRCGGWGDPFDESIWTDALEYDIGQPTGGYYLWREGTDPNGVGYDIYGRNYSKAWILFREKGRWDYEDYGDGTGVTYDLGGVYHLLTADGALLPPITQLTLRNAEAAILIPDSLVSIDDESFRFVPYPEKLRIQQRQDSINFMNVCTGWDIGIYNITGQLIRKMDVVNEGDLKWDLTNGKGQKIPSGVYLYKVETDDLIFAGKIIVFK